MTNNENLFDLYAIQNHYDSTLDPAGEFQLILEGITHAEGLELIREHDPVTTRCVLILWPQAIELPAIIQSSLEIFQDDPIEANADF